MKMTSKLYLIFNILFIALGNTATANELASEESLITEHCTESLYKNLRTRHLGTDQTGHGPDVGSDEWRSAVEMKLGIKKNKEMDLDEWCSNIQEKLSPSSVNFNVCDSTNTLVDKTVCNDKELQALDTFLSNVYMAALQKAGLNRDYLTKEQSGWLKGRNECWKAKDIYRCIEMEYNYRISALQAKYKLVPSIGPLFFTCQDNPANELVLTYYHTDPRTLIAERGDSVSLMYLKGISPIQYQGSNEIVLEKGNTVLVAWGYQKPVEKCISNVY